MPQLVIVDGPQMGRSYALDSVLRIGAEAASDVVLHGGTIAANQAEIASTDGGFVLRNLDGRCAIHVNGDPRDVVRLRHGDMIEIGGTQLLFSEDTEIDEPPGAEDSASQILSRQALFRDATGVIDRLGLDSGDDVDRRLVALYRISALLAESPTLAQLLERLLEVVAVELDADRAFVLPSEDEAVSVGHHVSWNKARGRVDEPPSVSTRLLAEVVRLRQGIVSTRDDDTHSAGNSNAAMGIVSSICVPLVRQNRLYGVLGLDSLRATRLFGERDLDYLSLLAGPAAAAIATLQTYEEPAQFSKNLRQLAWAIQQLSGNLKREELIKEIASMPCSVLRCRRSSVLLVDPTTGKLAMGHASGLDKTLWKEIAIAAGDGPAGVVLATGKSLLVPGDGEPTKLVTAKGRYQTDSYLIVPIHSSASELESESRVIGVVCVTDRLDGRRFTRNDQELLTILGLQAGIALANASLYEKATVDTLTRLYVRRHFFQSLAEQVRKAIAHAKPLSLLMLDLDHFKRLNDTHGHPAGDAVLREAGSRVNSVVRKVDIAARYGGEEFAVILPDTSLDIASTIADRVRGAIAGQPFLHDGAAHTVTVSIGVAQLGVKEGREQLIRRADAALYRAKAEGRDRVALDVLPPLS